MDSIKLAEYIDQWRVDNGLSQNELMYRAGLAGTFMTNLRRGADVQIGSLVKLAEAMGMSLAELLMNAGQAGELPERPDIIELIRTDPKLLPEAKQHLMNQYGLLLRVSAVEEDRATPSGPGLRSVARKRGPVERDIT